MVQGLRLHASNARDPGSVPGQGTRSHMLQLKILHAITKTWCSQINKLKKNGTTCKSIPFTPASSLGFPSSPGLQSRVRSQLTVFKDGSVWGLKIVEMHELAFPSLTWHSCTSFGLSNHSLFTRGNSHQPGCLQACGVAPTSKVALPPASPAHPQKLPLHRAP